MAGRLPDGFVPLSARDTSGTRTVGYGPAAQHDDQILITASAPAAAPPSTGIDAQSVGVHKHQGRLTTLTDEGRPYGFAVAWDERSDVHLVVAGTNGPTRQQTLDVADDVRSITDAEWQRLLVELSPDSHVGRVDPRATPVEVVHGTVGEEPYALTALVPSGYPLGNDDRRVDCFRLSFRADTSSDECPAHPNWARVGGQIFVFGDVGVDVRRVRVTGAEGTILNPFTVDTFAAPSGPPMRFYVAPLPEGTCAISVDGVDGAAPTLGETGPLQEEAADYTRCTGSSPGSPPTPPTTARG